jgi:hypothetical protein
MTVKELIEELQERVKSDPSIAEFKVISSHTEYNGADDSVGFDVEKTVDTVMVLPALKKVELTW